MLYVTRHRGFNATRRHLILTCSTKPVNRSDKQVQQNRVENRRTRNNDVRMSLSNIKSIGTRNTNTTLIDRRSAPQLFTYNHYLHQRQRVHSRTDTSVTQDNAILISLNTCSHGVPGTACCACKSYISNAVKRFVNCNRKCDQLYSTYHMLLLIYSTAVIFCTRLQAHKLNGASLFHTWRTKG